MPKGTGKDSQKSGHHNIINTGLVVFCILFQKAKLLTRNFADFNKGVGEVAFKVEFLIAMRV